MLPTQETKTFDLKSLRHAMGSFMTGVTIVTTETAEGERRGFTANSFTTVSLEPPLVLVCLANKAESYEAFNVADVFAVNILYENQRDSALCFASKRPLSFLYAVFEHDKDDGVYIIYRGTLATCPTVDRVGDYEVRMFCQDEMPWGDIDTFLYGALLRRYFDELGKARFGVYTASTKRHESNSSIPHRAEHAVSSIPGARM